jgi:probable poly-beta-1,6-N-acetyl-D-glucosamine export protein
VKNNFLSYIHNYRGFAILLIVGNHCRTAFSWPKESLAHDFLLYGIDSPTIVFVFISGFLFQYINAEKFNYIDYLQKKAKYVMLPYLLVSIPALADKILFESNAPWMTSYYKSLYPPFQVVYMLFTGKHSGPFYFIPLIGIIFLISPLLIRLQKSNYFTAFTTMLVGIGFFTFAYGYYGNILESLIYFLPVYIFGMWVSKNRERILGINNLVFLLLIFAYALIYTLEMTHVIVPRHLDSFEPVSHYFISQFNFGKLKEMIFAIVILVLFYKYRDKNLSLLHWLGSASFGIYFIHIYFINVLQIAFKNNNLLQPQSAISYIILALTVVSASAIAVYIVKKVFKEKSRLLIGS